MAHRNPFRTRAAAAVAAIVFGGALAAHSQSIDVDRKLGAGATAEVESTYGIVEHEKATAWVAAVGQRLVAGLGPQPFEYSFRLVNMTEPNAFAHPAGHVFVAPSLLGLARCEDELAGYDPSALASLLERIDAGVEIVTGAASHFSYLDSHPFTPSRARDIRKRAAKLRQADTPPVASGPVEILERLDGLPIGPDPAQGVFQENVFLHPEMGFAIDFPPGWEPGQHRLGGGRLRAREAGPALPRPRGG